MASRKNWSRFLASCVLFDPPEADLLAFAAANDPPLISYSTYPGFDVQAATSRPPVKDIPSMVNPPIVFEQEPGAVEAVETWYWTQIIEELARRYLPEGVTLSDAMREIDHDLNLSDRYVERFAAISGRELIVVDPDTTEEDVRGAFRLIAASHRGRSKGGRPPLDALVAVQCALLKRQGLSDLDIAERFGWPLRRDSYDKRRRSNAVINHVKLGHEILARRKNPS
jgi:hypothetical protein